ncbi:MAG: hypothetical protein KBB39_01040 [Phycicoccus sp.]|nr:hypothetical protein [Phycicoccus sp.]
MGYRGTWRSWSNDQPSGLANLKEALQPASGLMWSIVGILLTVALLISIF